MITNYYRVITAEVFQRIPVNGIVGGRDFRHKWCKDGSLVMVEREQGFDVNERWITHDEALKIVSTSDWTLTKEEFYALQQIQYGEG
jgi:hypothetical protein